MLFSSTHGSDPAPPPKPDYSKGYVWPVYPTYRIYTARPDGSDLHAALSEESQAGRDGGLQCGIGAVTRRQKNRLYQ